MPVYVCVRLEEVRKDKPKGKVFSLLDLLLELVVCGVSPHHPNPHLAT